jgi:hypothetical protein
MGCAPTIEDRFFGPCHECIGRYERGSRLIPGRRAVSRYFMGV